MKIQLLQCRFTTRYTTYRTSLRPAVIPTHTSDGAEGVEVFGGQQRRREFTDELLEQSGGVIRTDLVPAERTAVKRVLQLLLQHLRPTQWLWAKQTLTAPLHMWCTKILWRYHGIIRSLSSFHSTALLSHWFSRHVWLLHFCPAFFTVSTCSTQVQLQKVTLRFSPFHCLHVKQPLWCGYHGTAKVLLVLIYCKVLCYFDSGLRPWNPQNPFRIETLLLQKWQKLK